MKMTIRAVVLAAALLVGLAAPAMAGTRSPATSPTKTAITTSTTAATQNLANSRAVKWLMDNIAITKINLSPGAKQFVNFILKASLPIFCPLIAKAAAPAYQQLVKDQCAGIAAAPDPWEQLKQFTPLLCSFGSQIFPDYVQLLTVACGLLL